MLSKRLYKKPSFIALLLLIPICVTSFSFIAKQDSGFVQIVLAKVDKNDHVATKVIEDLSSQDTLISFSIASSEKEAIELVQNGSVNEAWIFDAETDDKVNKFIKSEKNPIVRVLTKEQNVMVRLAREKLTAALYRHCAKVFYIQYIRDNFPDLENVSDEQLSLYYQNAKVDDSLFVYNNESKNSDSQTSSNHLTLPIRGLLAFFAVLCGMAATMYYKQDEKIGTFSFVRSNRKILIAFGCVLTAVLHISAVLLISLIVSSLATDLIKELFVLILYALCCTAFCLLLGTIFNSIRTYSAIIPLLTVVCIGICPIFFDFRGLLAIQILLPPTYYVNAIYDSMYILYMVVYTLICIGLCFFMDYIKKTFRIWQKTK